VDYVEFKEEKEYSKIAISEYIPKYAKMSIEQKLKVVYTFIYQYSLNTNHDKKIEYYKSRGIDLSNRYLKEIGFLSSGDVKKLSDELLDLFPIQDLLEFGVMKKKIKNDIEILDKDGNPVYKFKQYCYKGFCVIPNFDLYSNTVTGLKLRNIELADWQSKNLKEPEMSNRQICYPMPFGLTRDVLLDKNSCIFLVEGHIDGLSLPVTSSRLGQSKIDYQKANTYFIASPGVNGMSQEILGLLKGKFVCLCFDQDEAGQKAAHGSINIQYGDNEKASFINTVEGQRAAKELIQSLVDNQIPYSMYKIKGMAEKLRLAGARVIIKNWNINLGGDCNELLQNGNLNKVFNF
jgi:DNA primase